MAIKLWDLLVNTVISLLGGKNQNSQGISGNTGILIQNSPNPDLKNNLVVQNVVNNVTIKNAAYVIIVMIVIIIILFLFILYLILH